MEQYVIFDMERHICLRYLWCLVIILVHVDLVHTGCPAETPDTQVVQMCTNKTASGTALYVDTSEASATDNATGPLCECHIHATTSGDVLRVRIDGQNSSCGARITLANTMTNLTTDEDNCLLTEHTIQVPTDFNITMIVEKLKAPYDAQFCAKLEFENSTQLITIECFRSERFSKTISTTTTTTTRTTLSAATIPTTKTAITSSTTKTTSSQMTTAATTTTSTSATHVITKSTLVVAQPTVSNASITTPLTAAHTQSTRTTKTTPTISKAPRTATATLTTNLTTITSTSTTSDGKSSSSTVKQALNNTAVKAELPGDGASGTAATFMTSYISVIIVLVSLAVAA